MANPSRLSVDSNVGDDEARPVWATLSSDRSDENLERTMSRRRSLECSSITVSIVGTEQREGHTAYVIDISSGAKTWRVYRRFNDFFYLDKQLRKNFPKLKIPSLPPKRYFASSTDPSFVEERRQLLETYLCTLVYMQSIWTRNDLVLFLNNPENSMMFIWNFERMRRMQDMLSSMKVESQSETAKLNTDLTLARSQVGALQERLSRMEMLLLQQATGLAAEELSTDAIRSLSGVSPTHASKINSDLEDDLAQINASMLEIEGTGADSGTSGADKPTSSSSSTSSSSATGAAGNNNRSSRGSGGSSGTPPRTTYASIAAKGASGAQAGPPPLTPAEQATIDQALDAHVQSGEAVSDEDVVKVMQAMASEAGRDPLSASKMLKTPQTPEELRTVALSLKLQEAVRISNDVLGENFDLRSVGDVSDPRRSSEGGGGGMGSRHDPAVVANLAARLSSSQSTLPPSSSREAELFTFSAVHARGSGGGSVASPAWVDALMREVDHITDALRPSSASLQARYRVFCYVRDVVSNTLGVQLFPVGSMVSHTYLPDSELATTAFIANNSSDDSWFVKINEALCMAAFSDGSSGYSDSKTGSFDANPQPLKTSDSANSTEDGIKVSNVSFVKSDVKRIKIMINNIGVDITMNQIGRLYSQLLLEKIDELVGQNHLFKRSVLLTTAWCQYESPRHTLGMGSMLSGSNAGGAAMGGAGGDSHNRLTPWAVVVMLIWVFNKEGRRLSHPLQALGRFLRTYASFDWTRYALTVKGPVDAITLEPLPAEQREELSCGELFFSDEFLDGFAVKTTTTTTTGGATTAASAGTAAPEGEGSSVEQTECDDGVAATATARGTGEAGGEGDSSAADEAQKKVTGNQAAAAGAPWRRPVLTVGDGTYQQSLINIVDPAAPLLNLAVNVDPEGYQAVTSALYDGTAHFQQLCEAFSRIDARKLSMPAAKTSTSALSQQIAAVSRQQDPDVTKVMKVFFLNTQLKMVGWAVPEALQQKQNNHPVPSIADVYAAQVDELDFSLRYGELALGGRVDKELLSKMIVQILAHKGTMPVGEIGKNIQSITGCANLSKRLKDQYNGLKRAIETCNSPCIEVGTEHPFNPFVTLVVEEKEAAEAAAALAEAKAVADGAPPPLHHADFVFTPVHAAAAAAAAAAATAANSSNAAGKDSSAKDGSGGSGGGGGGKKKLFQRQPAYYMDRGGGHRGRNQGGGGYQPFRPFSGRQAYSPSMVMYGYPAAGDGGGGQAMMQHQMYMGPPGGMGVSPLQGGGEYMDPVAYAHGGYGAGIQSSASGGGAGGNFDRNGTAPIPMGMPMAGSPMTGAAYSPAQQQYMQYMQQAQNMYQKYNQEQMSGTLSPVSQSPAAYYAAYMPQSPHHAPYGVPTGYAQHQQSSLPPAPPLTGHPGDHQQHYHQYEHQQQQYRAPSGDATGGARRSSSRDYARTSSGENR